MQSDIQSILSNTELTAQEKIESIGIHYINSGMNPLLDHTTRTLQDMLIMGRVLQHLQSLILDEIADHQYLTINTDTNG